MPCHVSTLSCNSHVMRTPRNVNAISMPCHVGMTCHANMTWHVGVPCRVSAVSCDNAMSCEYVMSCEYAMSCDYAMSCEYVMSCMCHVMWVPCHVSTVSCECHVMCVPCHVRSLGRSADNLAPEVHPTTCAPGRESIPPPAPGGRRTVSFAGSPHAARIVALVSPRSPPPPTHLSIFSLKLATLMSARGTRLWFGGHEILYFLVREKVPLGARQGAPR